MHALALTLTWCLVLLCPLALPLPSLSCPTGDLLSCAAARNVCMCGLPLPLPLALPSPFFNVCAQFVTYFVSNLTSM